MSGSCSLNPLNNTPSPPHQYALTWVSIMIFWPIRAGLFETSANDNTLWDRELIRQIYDIIMKSYLLFEVISYVG